MWYMPLDKFCRAVQILQKAVANLGDNCSYLQVAVLLFITRRHRRRRVHMLVCCHAGAALQRQTSACILMCRSHLTAASLHAVRRLNRSQKFLWPP